MKAIANPCERSMIIRLDKIQPFTNVCKVTGMQEQVNVKIEYIPRARILEVGSYREHFAQANFNEYIERLCELIFEELNELLDPKALKVTLFLDDDRLTPWTVTMHR